MHRRTGHRPDLRGTADPTRRLDVDGVLALGHLDSTPGAELSSRSALRHATGGSRGLGGRVRLAMGRCCRTRQAEVRAEELGPTAITQRTRLVLGHRCFDLLDLSWRDV